MNKGLSFGFAACGFIIGALGLLVMGTDPTVSSAGNTGDSSLQMVGLILLLVGGSVFGFAFKSDTK